MKAVTITLTHEQAVALEWIADYGIDEKQYVLQDTYHDYTEDEMRDHEKMLTLAKEALDVLRPAYAANWEDSLVLDLQGPGPVGTREAMGLRSVVSRKLHPVIARTFPLNDIVEAHRYMESNKQTGKIVVTV